MYWSTLRRGSYIGLHGLRGITALFFYLGGCELVRGSAFDPPPGRMRLHLGRADEKWFDWDRAISLFWRGRRPWRLRLGRRRLGIMKYELFWWEDRSGNCVVDSENLARPAASALHGFFPVGRSISTLSAY